jgi:hypothetical protein
MSLYIVPRPRAKERGIMDLIRLEWEIIDELQMKAKECTTTSIRRSVISP